MITADMREYDYYLYSEPNEYGQEVLIKDDNNNPIKQGVIKLAINITSQTIQDNINYKNAQYLALTHNKHINDKYVIKYGDTLLKVLYVNPRGRYIQVFMGDI